MKIILMDEIKSRKTQIVNALEKAKHKVSACSASNEFIIAVEEQSSQCVCMDFETWHHGRSVYSYINLLKKMESMPLIIYNTPVNYSTLNNRAKQEKDLMLAKPTEPDAILDAVASIA
jgi:DNA-binding NtrC family response regulator